MKILKKSDYDFVKTQYKSKEGDYIYVKYENGFIETKVIDTILSQRWCNSREPEEKKYITSHGNVWWDEIYTIKDTRIRNNFISNSESQKQKKESDEWFSRLSDYDQKRVNNIASGKHVNSGINPSEYGYYD